MVDTLEPAVGVEGGPVAEQLHTLQSLAAALHRVADTGNSPFVLIRELRDEFGPS